MGTNIRNSNAFRAAVAEKVQLQSNALCRRTDWMFAYLMLIQWVGAVAAALFITPRTWVGESSYLHPHFYLALFLGGTLCALPIWFAITKPGQLMTARV